MRRPRVSSSMPPRTSVRNVASSRLDTRWTSCSRASGTATVAALANGRRPTKVGWRSWSSPELFTSLSSSVIVRPEPSGPEARFEIEGWRTRLVANRATRSDSALSFGTSAGRWNRNAVFTVAAGSTTLSEPVPAEPPGYSYVGGSPSVVGAFWESIRCPRSASARIAFSDPFLRFDGARTLSNALGSRTSGTITNGVPPSCVDASWAIRRMTSRNRPPPVPPESEQPTMNTTLREVAAAPVYSSSWPMEPTMRSIGRRKSRSSASAP